jgi:hypothetical protein
MTSSQAISPDQPQDKSMITQRVAILAMRHDADADEVDAVDADAAKGSLMFRAATACAGMHRLALRRTTDRLRRCHSQILIATPLVVFPNICLRSDVVLDACSHPVHHDVRAAQGQRASQMKLRARSVTVLVAPTFRAAWIQSRFQLMSRHSSVRSLR